MTPFVPRGSPSSEGGIIGNTSDNAKNIGRCARAALIVRAPGVRDGGAPIKSVSAALLGVPHPRHNLHIFRDRRPLVALHFVREGSTRCRRDGGFDTVTPMPPTEPAEPEKKLQEIVEEVGLYPIEAYEFIQQGLNYTVGKMHGQVKDPKASRHVGGRDLCEGLRELALKKWGLLAPTVLGRWNIRRTIDFGRIVFALVDSGWMQKTDQDTVEDFRDVYDFKTAFESGYRIESKV